MVLSDPRKENSTPFKKKMISRRRNRDVDELTGGKGPPAAGKPLPPQIEPCRRVPKNSTILRPAHAVRPPKSPKFSPTRRWPPQVRRWPTCQASVRTAHATLFPRIGAAVSAASLKAPRGLLREGTAARPRFLLASSVWACLWAIAHAGHLPPGGYTTKVRTLP
jgi:hypothetical protein